MPHLSFKGFVATVERAQDIFEAARTGRCLIFHERPPLADVAPGWGFVFDNERSGIKRWTDSRYWGHTQHPTPKFSLYLETFSLGTAKVTKPRGLRKIVVQDLFSSLRLINYFTDEYYREENTLTIYTCVDEGDAQRNIITYQADQARAVVARNEPVRETPVTAFDLGVYIDRKTGGGRLLNSASPQRNISHESSHHSGLPPRQAATKCRKRFIEPSPSLSLSERGSSVESASNFQYTRPSHAVATVTTTTATSDSRTPSRCRSGSQEELRQQQQQQRQHPSRMTNTRQSLSPSELDEQHIVQERIQAVYYRSLLHQLAAPPLSTPSAAASASASATLPTARAGNHIEYPVEFPSDCEPNLLAMIGTDKSFPTIIPGTQPFLTPSHPLSHPQQQQQQQQQQASSPHTVPITTAIPPSRTKKTKNDHNDANRQPTTALLQAERNPSNENHTMEKTLTTDDILRLQSSDCRVPMKRVRSKSDGAETMPRVSPTVPRNGSGSNRSYTMEDAQERDRAFMYQLQAFSPEERHVLFQYLTAQNAEFVHDMMFPEDCSDGDDESVQSSSPPLPPPIVHAHLQRTLQEQLHQPSPPPQPIQSLKSLEMSQSAPSTAQPMQLQRDSASPGVPVSPPSHNGMSTTDTGADNPTTTTTTTTTTSTTAPVASASPTTSTTSTPIYPEMQRVRPVRSVSYSSQGVPAGTTRVPPPSTAGTTRVPPPSTAGTTRVPPPSTGYSFKHSALQTPSVAPSLPVQLKTDIFNSILAQLDSPASSPATASPSVAPGFSQQSPLNSFSNLRATQSQPHFDMSVSNLRSGVSSLSVHSPQPSDAYVSPLIIGPTTRTPPSSLSTHTSSPTATTCIPPPRTQETRSPSHGIHTLSGSRHSQSPTFMSRHSSPSSSASSPIVSVAE